jgi:uncharacterized membrane protein
MTKFEWDRQLKKGIASLPDTEQMRVVDFYNELFADKLELNMREEEIIAEFGNPMDVANRLIVDYYSDSKSQSGKERPGFVDFDEDIKRAEQNYRKREHPQHRYHDSDDDDSTVGLTTKQKYYMKVAESIIWPRAFIIFFVWGAFGGWHPAWMVFLLAVVVNSLCDALVKRNAAVFAYPVLATLLFLMLGFAADWWHPGWLIFVTIPLYYVLVGNINKAMFFYEGDKKSTTEIVTPDGVKYTYGDDKAASKKPIETEAQPNRKPSGWEVFAGVLLTIAFVYVAIIIWSTLIGLFVGGIGASIGGVAALIVSFTYFSESVVAGVTTLGISLVVAGVGMIFSVGVAALFKHATKLTKLMFATSSKLFSGKGE